MGGGGSQEATVQSQGRTDVMSGWESNMRWRWQGGAQPWNGPKAATAGRGGPGLVMGKARKPSLL